MSLSMRFFRWTYYRLSPGWVSWTLALLLLTVLGWSVEQASWVSDSTAISFNLVAGALVGAGLAISRWRGGWAAAYTLFLALASTLQAVGKVVPPLEIATQMQALDLLNLLNVRLFALFYRMAGWVRLYQAGESIRDTGLFLLIFGLAGGLAGAWLAWHLRRTRRPLVGLIPAGLLMALNLQFSRQDAWLMCGFLVAGLGLMARTTGVQAASRWDRGGVDYPEDLGLNWGIWAAVLALSICLVARVTPLFGTPSGWKVLNELFKPAQTQLENTASRIFADVKPPSAAAETLPRADTPQMGAVGAPPAQGTGILFYVTTDDPAPPPAAPGVPEAVRQSGPHHYWRSEVFASYTGRGWEDPPLDAEPFASPPEGQNAPPGRYALRQTFEFSSQPGNLLFAANQPVAVEGAGITLRSAGDIQSTLLETDPSSSSSAAGETYTVTSWANRLTRPQLEAAPTDYPAEIRQLYLQLPASLPQRVRDLASRLAAGTATPYAAAIRIQDYLRLTYTYALDVPPAPEGQDVVDYFLFQAQEGFCSYYSSAMAVMLRSLGIPARVASGFANGAYDETRKAYRVVSGDAHAWVEVFFPGLGWVEFEPTVSQSRIDYPAGTASGAVQPTPPAAGLRLSPGLTAALLVAVLGLGGGLLFLLYRFAGRPAGRGKRLPDPAAQARSLYRRMRAALAQAGLQAPPSLTPAEYLSRTRPGLASRPGLEQALEQATRVYEQAVYSSHPPALAEVESARQAWSRSLWEWVKLAASRKGSVEK